MHLATSLKDITQEDLQRLVNDGVEEGKFIEYKKELKISKDKDRKEFLADVTAFANASGGHLIFGIEEGKGEKKGIPIKVCGLELSDIGSLDSVKQKIAHLMQDSVFPRISGIDIVAVELSSSKIVLIMYIPKSWALPHMVKLKGSQRFYIRDLKGKHLLDIDELRSAFTLSETIAEKIRSFRAERLCKITAGETPARLENDNIGKLVLHIVPFSAFKSDSNLDMHDIDKKIKSEELKIPHIYNWKSNSRYNFDGILLVGYGFSYAQIFRNGILEIVDNSFLNPKIVNEYNDSDLNNVIDTSYEKRIIENLFEYISFFKTYGISPPFVIMLSIINANGYKLLHKPSYSFLHNSKIFDRNELILPEVLIESFDSDITEIMKPVFYTVWNTAGFPRSHWYDQKNKWIG
jgi:hypothetical protein